MKKIIILLILALLVLSSCNPAVRQPASISDDVGAESSTNEINETEPYVETTEMFGEIYPVVADTWHLSEWQYIPIKAFWFYEPIDFSPEAMKTYVKLPLEHEETVDGITFKVEFFQETYPIFSYIQARITYTNNTGISLRFINGGDKNIAGYFSADGEPYCGIFDSPDFDFITTADSTTLVPNGESHTVEVIYLFTNRFDPSKSNHTYGIDALFTIPDSGFPPETKTISISFPIEVLKHE